MFPHIARACTEACLAAFSLIDMMVSLTTFSLSHECCIPACQAQNFRRSEGRYHGGRRPSSDDSFHSPTVIPPSALDKPSIMKRYHRRRTTRWGVTARSPTMATLHDTRFVECRWWNDGWTLKTVVTWRSSASMIPAHGPWSNNAILLEKIRPSHLTLAPDLPSSFSSYLTISVPLASPCPQQLYFHYQCLLSTWMPWWHST